MLRLFSQLQAVEMVLGKAALILARTCGAGSRDCPRRVFLELHDGATEESELGNQRDAKRGRCHCLTSPRRTANRRTPCAGCRIRSVLFASDALRIGHAY